MRLRVVPKTPLPENRFERAIGNDLVDRRIDFGFQRLIAFAQTDDVETARERWSSGFQVRIGPRVKGFGRHVHHDSIETFQLEIAICADWIGVTAIRNTLLLQETRGGRVTECSDQTVFAVVDRVNAVVVAANSQL